MKSNSKIFHNITHVMERIRKKIERSIRFELMVVIGICFSVSFLYFGLARNMFQKEYTYSNIQYDYASIEHKAKELVYSIKNEENLTIDNKKFFNELFSSSQGKRYLVDLDGNIIYKSSNVVEDKIDIFSVFSNVAQDDLREQDERKVIYPLDIAGERCYFIYANTPTAYIENEVVVEDNSFFILFQACIVFIILFIIITNKKMKYLDEIALGLKEISNGDLSYRIEEKGKDEIKLLAHNINNMAKEINTKIEAERMAEKTKADLITNVSHDLRTPLTSIMGYIGLIKEGRYENEEQMTEYLNIAFTKSEKLKGLIEDLFEYTKLDNGGIKINKVNVNLNEFIFQLTEELMPLFEGNNLVLDKSIDEGLLMVNVDADKMVRVFENLLTNSIKYSFKPGKVNLRVYTEEGYAVVKISNRGEHIPKEKIEKLFDRFYRVEESRSENTGGTGLGLAIAKNIVELHGGSIWAECNNEEIDFFVKLKTSI